MGASEHPVLRAARTAWSDDPAERRRQRDEIYREMREGDERHRRILANLAVVAERWEREGNPIAGPVERAEPNSFAEAAERAEMRRREHAARRARAERERAISARLADAQRRAWPA